MNYRLPVSTVHGISQQEYWSGLPFLSPGDRSNPGIEPESPTLQVDSFLTELWGKPCQLLYPKAYQPWDFFGKNDAKAETPVLWPPHAKSWLSGKDSDAGRDWGQEEKGTTEDEMAGWHHWLDGHDSEWTPGDGDGQGGLACCNSWGHKELDTTEQLNWPEWKFIHSIITDYCILW